ncbi:MAG: biopolymer transporter ExbD [Bacteroidales bacterium]|nr:biopolymer transporter ExbD [Bacteroidales bacterium]MCF8388267.1 biopolymer transporter ExbD [Bacteroidales bacterium]MCF8399683.1 biopolymer transporter ExbD [Bacteroidales bacterium]
MARKVPEVNAGSMADIAFLLLIFFLVTTTMDVDTGIIRVLPPPLDKNVDPPKVKDRNIMKILVNSRDRLLINGEPGNINNLKEKVKDFMDIHPDNPNYPEIKMEQIEMIGEVPTTKGIISLKNDRGTSYKMYINVQDELAAAFRELRDNLSLEKFGRKYDDLVLEEQKEAIEKAIPIRVSEAEPEDVGGK